MHRVRTLKQASPRFIHPSPLRGEKGVTMTPEALAQIVASAVNAAVTEALAASAPVSADVAVKAASAPAKRTNRRTNRGSSKGTSGPKASAARGKKARKPFKPNEDWKGQE